MQEWEMTLTEIRNTIDNMEWSFSRVNSFYKCLYGAYLHYVEGCEDKDNAFGQYGHFLHEILEKILKQELTIFDAPQYYIDHYDEKITCDFPPNIYADLGDKAYNVGLEYLNSLNFDFDRYEVLAVEKEYKFKVGKYPFHGYIDALYRDKENGDIIIRDHKTSGLKYLKNGSLSKAKDTQAHFDEFKKQLYLYSIPVIEEYGKVDYLSWNMIRDRKSIVIPFDKQEFDETQQWAIQTIDEIRNEELWLPDTSNKYYCMFICGQSNRCIYHQ